MHRYIVLLAFSAFALPANAQRLLTSGDSTAIANAIVAELRTDYDALQLNVFVVDTGIGPWGQRIARAIRGTASTTITPTRTTPRAWFGELVVAGDTVRMSVSVHRCRENGWLVYSGTGSSHEFYRVADRWEPVPIRKGMASDGLRCPW